jgi:hypothetical protein
LVRARQEGSDLRRFPGLVETDAGEARVGAEPFDAIELDLASLWSR